MHTPQDDEQSSLLDTIHSYLDGFYAGDVAKLATVFHPTCALTQSCDGELHIIKRGLWLEMVQQRPSPAALGLPRVDQILSVDMVGPHMAHVKLKCAIVPRYFTDMLSLLKVEGRWQVVQKVYSTADAP